MSTTGVSEDIGAAVPVRIVHDLDEVRRRLTRRAGFEGARLSARMAEGVRRVFGDDLSAEQVVDRILAEVRAEGDAAVLSYTAALDGAALTADEIEIPGAAWDAALAGLDPTLRDAMATAADSIEAFHRKQLRTSWLDYSDEGTLGQILRPLERIGIYTPTSTAAYPSTLLMTAIPARVAGVEEIIVCAPPSGGAVSPLVLAAARIAGVDRLFQVGGAQAIGAMAFGTETVPRVDKIHGPGNIFVVLAKRRVFGAVAIDSLAGMTETLLVADSSADPGLIAADMLAQAEHDPMASAILLATDAALAASVVGALGEQLADLPRTAIAAESLAANGLVAVVPDVPTALDLANAYAPEHLCLLLADPWAAVPMVRHAGGVFVGEHSPEVLGDYAAGPSHVMPTGATARFSSPVHVGDFTKVISVVAANRRAVARLGPASATLARAEGLVGHARAIERRLAPSSGEPGIMPTAGDQ
ncbi:MAG: Histidinol dehydrogenase [uncultured Thermomicrobiales bacterium]|uniref:Histidinol dehydrogenase n=1 Tax=uncultured Thermomicrobiales bacterium TaxID=1645740 RepID=A0A6J4VAV7_9BACT|nr:MAG: Histidinol dehydrogenase [uncultured Thermomicrobiales bacterium]